MEALAKREYSPLSVGIAYLPFHAVLVAGWRSSSPGPRPGRRRRPGAAHDRPHPAVPRLPWAQSRGTDPPALLAQLRSGSGEESAAAAEVAELLGFLPLTLE
jgi:hypothetical protein